MTFRDYLLKNGTHIRYVGLIISVLFVLLSGFSVVNKGLNIGFDFTGGYLTEFTTTVAVSDKQMQQKIAATGTKNYVLTAQSAQHFQIKESDEQSVWLQVLKQDPTLGLEVISSSYLGSQVGDELLEQGVLALFTAMVAVMLYLAVRFEWRLAIGAVGALFHDIIIVLGIFSWLQLEFNLTVLASLLAIIGYSLNDSIIVGDRVRELLRHENAVQLTVNNVINNAISSTLTRTLITSGTTLATVGSVWLFAGAPLQGFSIALFAGIVFGTLSSICIAVTVPQLLGLSAENYKLKLDEQSQALMDMP